MAWKDRLKKLQESTIIDPQSAFMNQAVAKNNEAGIINRKVKSHDNINPSVICRANGCIEIFVSSDLGIRLDPKTESINIMCKTLNLNSKTINMNTGFNLEGVRWNRFPLIFTPVLPPGVGTISPKNTLPQDIAKFIKSIMG